MATTDSTNIDHTAFARDKEIQENDMLINRNRQARAVLSLLMMSMEDESPPTDDVVHDVIEAAQELLTV